MVAEQLQMRWNVNQPPGNGEAILPTHDRRKQPDPNQADRGRLDRLDGLNELGELDRPDPSDRDAILRFARSMEGRTLRELLAAQGQGDVGDGATEVLVGGLTERSTDDLQGNARNKGSFGSLVEQAVFGLQPNNASVPDFAAAGLELKTTPLKRVRNGVSAKERLVMGMIDYHQVVSETYECSHLMAKARDVLLISYLWNAQTDALDWPVALVEELRLDQLPAEDQAQIRADWNTVVEKVRAGHAHEISGSDTLYLEACTKGANASQRRSQPFSDERAKPRAWALKASYMSTLSRQWIAERMARGQTVPGIDAAAWAAGEGAGELQAIARRAMERDLDLLALVRRRFAPFFGMTERELGAHFGYGACRRTASTHAEGNRASDNPTDGHQGRMPKNLCALITRAILGVDEGARIAEFEKAGIHPKTIRLRRNGKPKEALSFPAFDYFELAETPFEDSAFAKQLEQRYLFVLYREDEQQRDTYRLSNVMFWQMPDSDLEEAARCYEEMRRRVADGRADESVKASENRCCHVRPHARNSRDTLPAPGGLRVVKKSFWLNVDYLGEQIAKQEAKQRKSACSQA